MKFIKIIFISIFFFTAVKGFSQNAKNVLIFTKTNGYRHASIEKGVATIERLGEKNHFTTTHSEDSLLFTKKKLKDFDLVLFLSTTGDILNDEQQKAFEKFIKKGGSFMGIHAAADTEYEWPWYGKLVGAYFKDHPNNPNIRSASIDVINNKHISCKHLSSRWKRDDEWYSFKEINPAINILLNIDESTYEGGTNGKNHPIAWYHKYEGGNSFYTAGGHTEASYDEPNFIQHLLGGIMYCLE